MAMIPSYRHRSSGDHQPRVAATAGTMAALKARATSATPQFPEPSPRQYAEARARGRKAMGR